MTAATTKRLCGCQEIDRYQLTWNNKIIPWWSAGDMKWFLIWFPPSINLLFIYYSSFSGWLVGWQKDKEGGRRIGNEIDQGKDDWWVSAFIVIGDQLNYYYRRLLPFLLRNKNCCSSCHPSNHPRGGVDDCSLLPAYRIFNWQLSWAHKSNNDYP